jgi:hypothetical protein
MKASRSTFRATLVGVVVIAAVGFVWWWYSPREFQGRLVYDPNRISIPEDPPAAASLVTANGTYELDIRVSTRSGVDWNRHRELTAMNGKQVIVRGTLGVRRSTYRPSRKHRTIHVLSLTLCPSAATTAPAKARGGATGGPTGSTSARATS